MCCFSRPVKFVGKTQIYARGLPRGEEALVYTMDVAFDEPLEPGESEDSFGKNRRIELKLTER